MSWLLLAALVTLTVATGLVVRAIIRGRREIRRLEEAERETRLTLVAYHARRSHEIAQALTDLGDDAEHVFPPSHDGR